MDDSGVSAEALPNKINTRSQDVTITITGTNDTPVITGAIDDFGFTEAADASAQDLSETGTLSFDDIDTTDVIDVTHAFQTAAVWSGGTIDAALKTLLEGGFAITGTDEAAPGSVSWSYTVNDANLDFLAAGETITLSYRVTVTDSTGATASDDVTITITGTNDGPLVAQQPQKQIQPVNVNYSRDMSALFSDVDTSDRLTYSATGFPDGLSVDAVTGRITGRPTAAGSFNVVITADDGNGGRVSTLSYEFLIVAPPSDAGGGNAVAPRPLPDAPLAARMEVPVTVQSVQAGLSSFGTRSLVFGNEAAFSAADRFEPNVLPPTLKVISYVLEIDQTARELGLPSMERIISGSLTDGSPLPSWLDFNPDTRSFAGVVPPEVSGQIDIVLIYLDTFGTEQRVNVRIDADTLAISVSGISDASDASDADDQTDEASGSESEDEASIDWDAIEERLFGRGSNTLPPEQGGLRAQMDRIL
jgi:VCBS repeat-containing protein